jgi:hypothetical protein
MQKEAIVKSPSGRIKRIDARSGPLTVRGKEPGYVYRVVNDVDDRVESFKEAGYELVADKDVAVGVKRVNTPSVEGSVKRISVGAGIKGVLMRQREDFYTEDQTDKEARIKDLERSTKKEALDGNYGNLKTTWE